MKRRLEAAALFLAVAPFGGPDVDRLARAVPPELLPPAPTRERIDWAARSLAADDASVREAAVRCLALEAATAWDAIDEASRASEWRARAGALDAAARGAPLLADAASPARLVHLAIAGARDAHRGVRRSAARLLAEAGAAGEATQALATLLADPFFDVRLEA
ncbi:MAG TPA: hypothetical protein VKE69_10975, partial [Planctomycetota bacterium]|nr:hypothetical protein [Planctomycetota bacterium]